MAGLDQYFIKLSHGSVPQREAMKYEALRLSTFAKIPPSVAQSAVIFASAGFFYSGMADEVECYCCGLRFKDWRPEDNPLEIHKKYGPNCPYIMNNSDNQPLASKGIFQSERVAASQQPVNGMSQTLSQLTLAPQSDAVIEEAPVTPQSTPPGDSRNFHRPNPGDPPVINGSPTFARQSRISPSPTTLPVNGNTQNARPAGGNAFIPDYTSYDMEDPHSYDYRYERSRLASFKNWPSNAAVKPEDVAKSGFFYTGMDDRVQCAFCRGILRNWELNDIPDSEHRRHFGQCPFLLNPNDVGNVSLSAELSDSGTDGHALATSVITEKPTHQQYVRPDQRLVTFKNFPKLTQSPEQLAKAGFFYSGIADNVKCFFCDGGLRNWEPNDDPWNEHARWFPRCGYLRLNKGDEFIKDVQSKFAPPAPHQKPPRMRHTNLRRHLVDQKRVTEYMRSRIVQAVLAMDMERDKVRQAIVRRMEDLGSEEFPNVESLVDAVVEYEEELKYREQYGDEVNEDSQDENATNEFAAGNKDDLKSEKKKKKKKKNNKNKKSGSAQNDNQTSQSETGTQNGDIDEHNVVGNTGPMQYMNNDDANRLSEDVQKLKDERTCKICMDEEVNIVFLRCGHLVCCGNCAPALRHCPICRELIRGTVRVFLS